MRHQSIGSWVVLAAAVFASHVRAGDWPQFRYDAGRTAASPDALPPQLHLQWSRDFGPPQPAYPREVRLRYDASYEPVVLGKRIFVPSMVTDTVTALDTDTGAIVWQFFADGPVRFAPVAAKGKVYFGADDGFLYCVSAERGELLWKFRGLPADRPDRWALANGRLISLRPVRGGPVLADGVVYFGAGIWLGDGTFLHALDAETGKVIWSNVDSHLIAQSNLDHGSKGYAGVSPHGYLAVVGDKLIVPCGAQLPAFFDRRTGTREPYTMGWGGRVGLPKGSWFSAGAGKYLVHSGDLYDLTRPNDERFELPFEGPQGDADFKRLLYPGGYMRLQIDPTCQRELGAFREPVLTSQAMYYGSPVEGLVGYDLTKPNVVERAKTQVPEYRQADRYPDRWTASFPKLFQSRRPLKVHLLAGSRLYASERGRVEALDLPADGGEPKTTWQTELGGTPTRLLAADEKLFAVTQEGRLYAFGGQPTTEPVAHAAPAAMLCGVGDPRTTAGDPRTTPGGTDADAWAATATRILQATNTTDGYALVLGAGSGRLAEELLRRSALRVIAVDARPERVAALRQKFQQAGLYGPRITVQAGDPLGCPLPPYLAKLIVSEEPADLLSHPGAATLAQRLFLPLRPYGGTVCLAVPTTDGRQKLVEQFAQAKLPGAVVRTADEFVLLTRAGPLPGADAWTHDGANPANTGATGDQFLQPPVSILWWDGSVRWFRGAGGAVLRVADGRMIILGNKVLAVDVFTGRHLWEVALPPTPYLPAQEMVLTPDAVYVPHARTCLRLDPASGKTTGQIDVPAELRDKTKAGWTQVRVSGDHLVGVIGRTLVCVNRHTGQSAWQAACQRTPLSLAIGQHRVYCAEPGSIERKPEPADVAVPPRTSAYDLLTGRLLWQIPVAAVLRYSDQHDLLVTAQGLYRAADGSLVRKAEMPAFLAGELLISEEPERLTTRHLLTGEAVITDLAWRRRGCTNLRAGLTLLTTRSGGNAAYVDLATRQVVSLWNVRAGCQNNLVPADGLLNAPNVSGGCECNYLPASLAFAPQSAWTP